MENLVLIDGNSILNRAFYGTMATKMLMTEDGTYTNAIYGFLNIMFKIIEDIKPEYMVVTFDLKAPTYRHKLYSEYKANRKGMPNELASQMPILKEILKAMNVKVIEKEGYEAYVVGGYVRDLLLGISSYDIDICTNATPKELMNIFPSASPKNLGGIDFKIKEYHIEITTYREEIKYKNRKPIEFNYINNLVEDLQRRDFTVNAICMNSKGEIIDLVGGIDDLSNLKIKSLI